jgi:hypothetical protein
MSIDLGRNAKHSEKLLKTYSETNAFAKKAKQIHAERCDADLMYAILNEPTREIKLPDGTRIQLVDRILRAFTDITSKKNAPAYEQSVRIRSANAFLQSEAANATIKQFNILFLLHKEPEFVRVIQAGYIEAHPGNLWGPACHAHLDQFLAQLGVMIEMTLNWDYNELNIVDTVRNFVVEANKYYMTT